MTNKKNKLIPKLRFPEFENDGEWENVSIENVGNVVTGNTPSKKESSFWGGNNIWITAQDFKGKYLYDSVLKLTNEGREKVRIIPKNSVLVTCIASIGLNGINKVECSTNQQINSIICNSSYGYNFVYYAIESNLVRLKRFAGQTAVPIITKSAFEKFNILTPPSLEEQQKIANCLSSLDELIEVQEEKLKLLKEHKKGLMQQLFPQANDNRDVIRGGNNLPKLRFPEFINDGAWEEKTLGEISFSIFDGTHQTPKYTEEGIPFFSVENLISKNKNKFISKEDYLILTAKNKPEKDDILITRIGNIGFSTVVSWDYEFSIYVTLATVKKSDKFIPHYLNGYFQSEVYQKEIRSKSLLNAVPMKINMNDLRDTKVLLPTIKEQQKIADCLSSLDETIEVQDQKIELLKQHKKGLMQGLFPVMN